MKKFLLAVLFVATLASCSEQYGQGERIGLITKFSRSGLWFKSWEGELHVTQTGMNSTMNDFNFSIDNNVEEERTNCINTLDSAAKLGWKVRLHYHQVQGKNITSSRGDTNYFVDSVQVLDKFMSTLFNNNITDTFHRDNKRDTVYFMIVNKPKN